jgi:hypothetical protein
MISLNFIADYAPLLVLLISFIVVYSALIMLKVPGSKVVLAILSLLIAVVLATSNSSVNFIFNAIPYLMAILAVFFAILLILAFVAKDIDAFKKPLAWIGFILAFIVILCMAFNSFPTLHSMLPGASSSSISSTASDFKDFIYSSKFKEGFIFVIIVAIVGFILVKAKS